MYKNLVSELQKIKNLNIREDEPMSAHTSFKTGGPAKLFLEANSISAATEALDTLSNADIEPVILGNGSNVLFPDSEFERVVLKLCCKAVSLSGDEIYAESGATLTSVANLALKSSLTGFEFAYGIPGTVGGALVMNAGAYGGEISDVLSESTYYHDGKVYTLRASEHEFTYRGSLYKNNPSFTILSAKFKLSPGEHSAISSKMKDLASRRREKQPLEFPSAGSTFKRPPDNFAGALIEQCGLKGYSIGGAEVSEKHAGFIINKQNATSEDIKHLIDHVRETVKRNTGVDLECEICIL